MHSNTWAIIVSIAEESHGCITGEQLRSAGVTRQQRRTLLGSGQLHAVGRSIYQVVGPPVTWRSRLLVHCLKLDGLAFGTSAAMLQCLGKPADLTPGFAELLVPSKSRPTRPDGIRVIRGAVWDSIPKESVQNIPCLPLPETLVSLGLHHDFIVFRSAFNEARRTGRINSLQFADAAHPFLQLRVRGRKKLQRALDSLEENPPVSLSEWSDHFADLCELHGLARPVLEYRITDTNGRLVAQVDACWPDDGVVVELDSWAWHHSRQSFESDRKRFSRLSSMGWAVIVVTWRQWEKDPGGVMRDIRSALERGNAGR